MRGPLTRGEERRFDRRLHGVGDLFADDRDGGVARDGALEADLARVVRDEEDGVGRGGEIDLHVRDRGGDGASAGVARRWREGEVEAREELADRVAESGIVRALEAKDDRCVTRDAAVSLR